MPLQSNCDVDTSTDYPSFGRTVLCGWFENTCAAGELWNSNSNAYVDYASTGFPQVTVEEGTVIEEETGRYAPGTYPSPIAPFDWVDHLQILFGEHGNRREGSEDRERDQN